MHDSVWIEFRRGTGLSSVTAKFTLEGHKPYEVEIRPVQVGLVPNAILSGLRAGLESIPVVLAGLSITSPVSVLASDAEWPLGLTVILPELDSPSEPYDIPLQHMPPSATSEVKGGE